MTSEELRDLINEAFVQILVQRVVEKLIQRRKEALVVYTGAMIGADAALGSMGKLRKDGFVFHVLLSDSAAKLHDVERIRKTLEPADLWIGTPSDAPGALAKRYDIIIVPAMTVHTASHVAACMADTPASAVILDGLMFGKKVIVDIDACCPDNEARVKLGYNMPEPLKQVLRSHLETLQSFGALLTSSKGLYSKVMKTIAFTTPNTPAAPKAVQSSKPASNVIHVSMEGKIFSGRHLKGVPSGATVVIPAGAMVTQMATDEARLRGIKITKEA